MEPLKQLNYSAFVPFPNYVFLFNLWPLSRFTSEFTLHTFLHFLPLDLDTLFSSSHFPHAFCVFLNLLLLRVALHSHVQMVPHSNGTRVTLHMYIWMHKLCTTPNSQPRIYVLYFCMLMLSVAVILCPTSLEMSDILSRLHGVIGGLLLVLTRWLLF